jgi:lipopolysaccharide transport protein LptA
MLAAALVGVLATGAWAGAQQPASTAASRRTAEITLDAVSSEVDYVSNRYLFRTVTITQGDLRVQADEARATGTDFDNATWEFRGRVQIKLPAGSLKSDLARVQFRNNAIASARIEGQPAEFEQQRANNPEPARGHARNIDFDVASNTVRLSNEAWLSDGRNDIKGNELVYSLVDQKVRAQAKPGEPGGGIRITIRPATPAPGRNP